MRCWKLAGAPASPGVGWLSINTTLPWKGKGSVRSDPQVEQELTESVSQIYPGENCASGTRAVPKCFVHLSRALGVGVGFGIESLKILDNKESMFRVRDGVEKAVEFPPGRLYQALLKPVGDLSFDSL